MINCEVLRESLSVSINLFLYYNSLADLILVFTLWRIPLKFAQSCGLLDLMTLIFSTSRHGQKFRTWRPRNGSGYLISPKQTWRLGLQRNVWSEKI